MNERISFCITLGHNSSCSLVNTRTGLIISAYEEERFNRIKSDKSFAINSILKCINDAEEICGPKESWKDNNVESEIFISHWYDNFEFYKNPKAIKNERYDYIFMEDFPKIINCKKIHYLNQSITHHDAHGYGALAFYSSHKEINDPNKGHVVVIDGFGNNQEVISIYKFNCNENNLDLIFRYYGYKNSLGLMYEFATEYMGMKPHEDEYKALGYESKIHENLSDKDISTIYNFAYDCADDYINAMLLYNKGITDIDFNPDETYINIEEFEQSKNYFYSMFDELMNKIESEDRYEKIRFIISYFIQTFLEKTAGDIIVNFCNGGETTLLLSGGVAYNVKMNNCLMMLLYSPMDKYKFSVYPLAGDQGAALGFYHAINRNLNLKEGNLCFGKRSLKISDDYFDVVTNRLKLIANDIRWPIHVSYNKETFKDLVLKKLLNDEIVEIIHGNMEFGPRALLSNSTLAIPTEQNVNIINSINGRNTVMPFAPLVTEEGLQQLFFNDYECVVGSLRYMILTLNYKRDLIHDDKFMFMHKGVMHNYPEKFIDENNTYYEEYSGRPQVIDKYHYMYPIMKELEKEGIMALIQTSFNVHGRPIVYSVDDALSDFEYQLLKRRELGITRNINLIFCDF